MVAPKYETQHIENAEFISFAKYCKAYFFACLGLIIPKKWSKMNLKVGKSGGWCKLVERSGRFHGLATLKQ
ncbi:MAG: hypothetical protein IKY23_00980 [Lachnospiraceae bacterium]|nr:hypothetical protein [Lachnospiraceae bacterium]